MAGLYVHIPFCHGKCAYCDFYSSPSDYALSQRAHLVHALITEYDRRAGETGSDTIDTVYLGGGTPSILDIADLGELIDGLKRVAQKHAIRFMPREMTIEVNPEDITADKAAMLREIGFDRVSMGVQSLVDDELTILGRRHTASEAIDAVHCLQSAGFANCSLDLIYGIPNQTLDSWEYSLKTLIGLNPTHISAYILTYEPRTLITAKVKSGNIVPLDDDLVADMYTALCSIAHDSGYRHYEISNFARPGYEAVHNSSYWSGTPYIGLGPSAHSFDGRMRRVNCADLKTYLNAISSGEETYEVEKESRTDRYNDMIVTALRTARGIDFGTVKVGRRRQLLCDAYPHLKNGNLKLADRHLYIPEDRWIVSDDIMRDLILL